MGGSKGRGWQFAIALWGPPSILCNILQACQKAECKPHPNPSCFTITGLSASRVVWSVAASRFSLLVWFQLWLVCVLATFVQMTPKTHIWPEPQTPYFTRLLGEIMWDCWVSVNPWSFLKLWHSFAQLITNSPQNFMNFSKPGLSFRCIESEFTLVSGFLRKLLHLSLLFGVDVVEVHCCHVGNMQGPRQLYGEIHSQELWAPDRAQGGFWMFSHLRSWQQNPNMKFSGCSKPSLKRTRT